MSLVVLANDSLCIMYYCSACYWRSERAGICVNVFMCHNLYIYIFIHLLIVSSHEAILALDVQQVRTDNHYSNIYILYLIGISTYRQHAI